MHVPLELFRGWYVQVPKYVHVPLEAARTSQKTEYMDIPPTLNQRPQYFSE